MRDMTNIVKNELSCFALVSSYSSILWFQLSILFLPNRKEEAGDLAFKAVCPIGSDCWVPLFGSARW